MRSHLLVFVLAVLLPAFASGGAAAWMAVQEFRATAAARLLDTARALRLALDSEVDRVQAALVALDAAPSLAAIAADAGDGAALSAFHAQAEATAARLDTLIALVDRDGRQLLVTGRPPGTPLPPNPRLPDVQAAIDRQRSVVSSLALAGVSGRQVAAVIEPVTTPPGAAPLALVARLDPQRLSSILAAQDLARGEFATLVDATRRIVARSAEAERLLGQQAGWLGELPSGQARGIVEASGPWGGPFRLGYDTLEAAPGWVVAVGEPRAVHTAAILRPVLVLMLGVLAVAAAAVLAGTILMRRILQPVEALAASARRVAQGGAPSGAPPEDGGMTVPTARVSEFEALRLDIARAEQALRAGDARLREALGALAAVYDTAPVGLAVLDAEGRFLRINARLAEINGLPAEAHLGRTSREILPGLADAAEELLRRVLTTGEPVLGFEIEGETPARPGVRRSWVESWLPLRDAAGRIVGVNVVAEEVTALRAATRALALSEERLLLATSGAGIGIWEVDFVSGRAMLSAEAQALLGTSAQLRVATWLDAVHPDDRARIGAAFERWVARGTTFEEEYRTSVPAPDGGERWLLGRGAVERDAAGMAVRGAGVVIDITARRRAEVALVASEAWLRLATEGAGVGTWELDIPSGRGRWSSGTRDLLGAPRDDYTLEEWLAAIHPADRAATAAAWQRAVAEGEPYRAEFRAARPAADGGEVWLLTRGQVERDAAGAPRRGAGVVVDVTARRRAEAALRDREAALRAIFEGTLVGMAEADPATLRFIRVNRRFCEMVGFAEAELLGRSFLDITHPEDRAANEAGFRAAMEGSDRFEMEKRYRRKDGATIWAIVQVARLGVDGGGPARAIAAILDITERKRAEERQALLAREVDHRAKNALSVVQAALRLTPKEDAQAYARAVEGRVGALARAQTLLAADRWTGADLRALLTAELGPFILDVVEGGAARSVPPGAPCATLEGPEVALPPRAAQPLAMAVHELATNAVKYGALSVAGGRLAVAWSLGRSPGGETMLRLSWEETGGPALDRVPARRGFGTRVIDGTVRGQLGGELSVEWRSAGLRCTLEIPLREPAPAEVAPDAVPAAE